MTEAVESNNPIMRIALICPFSSGPGRGNITTVRRIADHLPATGCRITLVNLDTMNTRKQQAVLDQACPDLLHAFNAFHAGPTARRVSRDLNIPYIITITGSDLFDNDSRNDPGTRLALSDAAAVTCFDPLVALSLSKTFPHISGRLSVIPQGVAPLPLLKPFHDTSENFIIMLPAALRPVKGVYNAIQALTPLALEFPSLRLLVVGGAIDKDYANKIHEIVATLPWVQMLGDVPYQQMGSLYAAADLVLNSSVFEGGMANAMLEAMIMGKPVLASDVLGNRSLIRHNETGWLYRSDGELRALVRPLLLDTDLGDSIGEAGKNYVKQHCSPQDEVEKYACIYRSLVAKAVKGSKSS